MTIGIARTPGGRLWACWVAGEDGAKAFFVCAGERRRRRDVVEAGARDRRQSEKLPMPRSVLVGNLWTASAGRLWIFFNQSMAQFDGRSGVWAAICENPDAAKPVWSAPKRLWHGFTLNKPTVLSNGDWLLPISLNRAGFGPFKGAFAELDPFRRRERLSLEGPRRDVAAPGPCAVPKSRLGRAQLHRAQGRQPVDGRTHRQRADAELLHRSRQNVEHARSGGRLQPSRRSTASAPPRLGTVARW